MSAQRETEKQLRLLLKGELTQRSDVEEAFMAVVNAVWWGGFNPSVNRLPRVELRRYGYLLETIKLFTRDRFIAERLERRIQQARLAFNGDAVEQGFLPDNGPAALVESRDDLAEFWGLRGGIKIHRIPGFLEAHFALREVPSGDGGKMAGVRG